MKRLKLDSKKLVLEYAHGATISELARQYSCSTPVVHRAIRNSNTHCRSFVESRTNDRTIAQLVAAGHDIKTAAAQVGYAGEGGQAALLRFAHNVQTLSATHQKYGFDKNFFDIIDTEEKAYWLGFMFADGTIVHHAISLRLAQVDRQHLVKFRYALKSKHPVSPYTSHVKGKDYSYSRLLVHSPHTEKSLAKYGCTPNKTERTSVNINMVPKQFHRHFWRGFVDGDGTIGRSRNGKWVLGACGSKMMMNTFRKFIRAHVRSRATVRPNKSIFRVTWSSFKAQCVARILYQNCTVALDRKNKLATQLLSETIRERHD